MNVQISNALCMLFEELCHEYFNELMKYNENSTEYLKHSEFIFGNIINPSTETEYERIQKRDNQGLPVVRQLYKNRKTIDITHKIAELIIRSNRLLCLPNEVYNVVDAIVFASTSEILYSEPLPSESEQRNVLKNILKERVSILKKQFYKYEFKFPIHVFGLERNLSLYKDINLVKEDNLELEGRDLEQYMHSRTFEPNYSIHIISSVKSSKEYSSTRAIRAREATTNLLTCLYGVYLGNDNTNGPFIKDEDYNPHYLHYFSSGKKGETLEGNRLYKFHYNADKCKQFWDVFENDFSEQVVLHNLLFSIPSKIINNDNFDKTVASLTERSLRWFADAINEKNYEIKIVKLAIAIESLVNFYSDSKKSDANSEKFKEIFIKRVCIINTYDKDVESKATKLYKARSSIAHGSTLKITFDFDVIRFTAATILLAIQLFSMFENKGLDETGFDKRLPKFIEGYG
ncbi:HEPN domain-containing protein [Vibrio plantisponsor]|uniref:HEPN domain-containing protein n=1 Tax=Vibrio plantisponsor TaxID=664643 RepID=A0ABU4IFX2_9VIBR|nr:HEPN domain-containing protein [Vibrio plantisponsor]MDW6016742.1 HEPN domain-containing protein [Vibrio plantisponsor]NNM39887.1 hypothetical protein [Vibrio plantisponsor]